LEDDTVNAYTRAAVAALAAIAPITLATLPAGAATTQSEDAAMTRLAVRVLSDASAARAALASNRSGAQTDIRRALAADRALASEARSAGLPQVVPIYAELDDTAFLSSAVKRKAQTTGPQTVRQNVADLTYLAIDLDAARSHLRAAQTALRNENDRAVRDFLAAVGDDLVEQSTIMDLPLVTAREDLSRAQRELKANDRAAAVADLRQASRSLGAYTGNEHGRDVELLAARIDSDATAGSAQRPDFGARVEHWWSSVKSWVAQRT
jgi:HPt (histidine-containing phosphotransfer) domain-containing protein